MTEQVNKDASEFWRAVWAALCVADDDLLSLECPIEHANAVLRDAGVDPVEAGRKGAALVKELTKWRDE